MGARGSGPSLHGIHNEVGTMKHNWSARCHNWPKTAEAILNPTAELCMWRPLQGEVPHTQDQLRPSLNTDP